MYVQQFSPLDYGPDRSVGPNEFGSARQIVVRTTVSRPMRSQQFVVARTDLVRETVVRTTVSVLVDDKNVVRNESVPPRTVETSEESKLLYVQQFSLFDWARTDLVRNVKLLYVQQFWVLSRSAQNCCTLSNCAPEARLFGGLERIWTGMRNRCTYNSFGVLADDKTVVRTTVSRSAPNPFVLPRTVRPEWKCENVVRTTVFALPQRCPVTNGFGSEYETVVRTKV